MSTVSILIGSQWGDEGKGKWIDCLAKNYDIIARFQGGNNAGHTLFFQEKKLVLHQLPSGILNKEKLAVLLAGVVVDPVQLQYEINSLQKLIPISPERLWISGAAHVITPFHIFLDNQSENTGQNPIGTTRKGIGPTYRFRVDRIGLSMADYVCPKRRQAWLDHSRNASRQFDKHVVDNPQSWQEFEEGGHFFQDYVVPAEQLVRSKLFKGSSLLFEGAQGVMLDVIHGTYPFVTSSSTIAGGAIASLGIDPRRVDQIIGVAKAYVTRVGEGPLPSEIFDETGDRLRDQGKEFGSTTSRPRRCGWFDAVAMRYAVQLNGLDTLILNKMDVLAGFNEVKIATAYSHITAGITETYNNTSFRLDEVKPIYETLPGWDTVVEGSDSSTLSPNALHFIHRLEKLCGVAVSMVGYGPRKSEFVTLGGLASPS